MNLLLLLLYLFIGIFIVLFSTETVRKDKTWTVKLWVQIWLGVYYVLIPVLFILFGIFKGKYPGTWPDLTIKHSIYTDFNTFWASALFFLAFYLALSIKIKEYVAVPIQLKLGIYRTDLFRTLIYFMLAFGLFSLFYYVLALGGFLNAFKIAPYLGSPFFEDIYSKKYAGLHTMFKRFIPIVIYGALIFKFHRGAYRKILLGIIPFIAFAYFTFLERQRQFTLMIFLIPLLGYMVEDRKFVTKKFLIFFGVLIFLFPTITFLNKAFVYDKDSYEIITAWFNVEKYIKEFNFAQISLFLSQNASYDKFWFADVVDGIYGNYLPTSLRSSETVNGLNSYLFLGVEDRSIPPGLIGNSFYHLGYIGVFLWGSMFGFFINVFEVFWKSIVEYDRRFSYAYVFTFMTFFAYIRTGVLGFSLYRPFFAFLILILLFSFIFKVKEVSNE